MMDKQMYSGFRSIGSVSMETPIPNDANIATLEQTMGVNDDEYMHNVQQL